MIKHNVEAEDELYKWNNWHRKVQGEYTLRDGNNCTITFNISRTISGCGSIMINGYNLFGVPTDVIKEDLKQFFYNLKQNGIGAIITTLGEMSFSTSKEKLLTDVLEMICVSEYNNYRHRTDGSYKQKLYIKTL